MRINKIKAKLKEFFRRYELKIALFLGLILISAISFEIGALKGQEWRQEPLIIEKAAGNCSNADVAQESGSEDLKTVPESGKDSQGSLTSTAENCRFVGSKNSDKYHLPGCQWVKRIKPENMVCFKDEQEAEKKGYVPASCCVKK